MNTLSYCVALSILALSAANQVQAHGMFTNPQPRTWGGYNTDKDTFPLNHPSGETPFAEGTCRGISTPMTPTRLGNSFSVDFGGLVSHQSGSPCKFELRDLSLNVVIHTIREYSECFGEGTGPKQLTIPQDAVDKCGEHCVLYWHWEANHRQPSGQPSDRKYTEIFETCADVTFGGKGHNTNNPSNNNNNNPSNNNNNNQQRTPNLNIDVQELQEAVLKLGKALALFNR